jgi:hypothetical protein
MLTKRIDELTLVHVRDAFGIYMLEQMIRALGRESLGIDGNDPALSPHHPDHWELIEEINNNANVEITLVWEEHGGLTAIHRDDLGEWCALQEIVDLVGEARKSEIWSAGADDPAYLDEVLSFDEADEDTAALLSSIVEFFRCLGIGNMGEWIKEFQPALWENPPSMADWQEFSYDLCEQLQLTFGIYGEDNPYNIHISINHAASGFEGSICQIIIDGSPYVGISEHGYWRGPDYHWIHEDLENVWDLGSEEFYLGPHEPHPRHSYGCVVVDCASNDLTADQIDRLCALYSVDYIVFEDRRIFVCNLKLVECRLLSRLLGLDSHIMPIEPTIYVREHDITLNFDY